MYDNSQTYPSVNYRPKKSSLRLEDIDLRDPDSIKRASKADKTVITLVTLTGQPTRSKQNSSDSFRFFFRQETVSISRLWQIGLYNNHIDINSFLVDDDRVMFSALDGATAFDVKDFLIEQERVDFVEIDQDIFPGKFTTRKYEL